jgi:mono/diheme cytochrome c family protein
MPASTATTAAPAASAAATASASAATTAKPGPKADLTKLPKPSDKTDLTFDKDIAPILKVSCSGCHIGSARPSGGFDLSTLATALKGGSKGKTNDIVAGHADQSNVVLYTSGALPTAMPPKPGATHPALTSDQIALIMAWINQGAK